MEIIARIYTDFPTKFGIPRQSGIESERLAEIVFEPDFRDPDCIRGLEEFSHLWVIFAFSENKTKKWSHTVRPPRLGGNKRMGVFATRSPFRPNAIGLSSLEIKKISIGEKGPVISVSGADMVSGTPIYDIKPYLAYTDSHPEAKGGFSDAVKEYFLDVEVSDNEAKKLPLDILKALKKILSGDPRPSYQNDENRVYALLFAGFEVKFKVSGRELTVISIEPFSKE